jgi:deazaflavin-dependent oxidoreductase (nitroreductase family)
MTVATHQANNTLELKTATPRFGGVLWRLFGATNRWMLPMAGRRWNPVFAVVEHLGRRSGRRYRAPVAARRVDGGFVMALAFGAQVDWHRNLIAAHGGTVGWRDRTYPVGAPERLDTSTALAAFHPIQRLFLRLAKIDGYVSVRDVHAIL